MGASILIHKGKTLGLNLRISDENSQIIWKLESDELDEDEDDDQSLLLLR